MRGSDRRAPDIIPLAVRYAVRDAAGGQGLTVGRIDDLFQMEGFSPDLDHLPVSGGARRAEVEIFDVAIDYTRPSEVDRYLRVVTRILDDLDNDDFRAKHEALTKELVRYDIEPDERGWLRMRRSPVRVSAPVPDDSDIRFQLDRLERLDQEPEEMIGAAKDLVEAVARHVLLDRGREVPAGDVVAISKAALQTLRLTPDLIAPTARGAETMRRLLASLGQVAGGIEELRNLYGTGHGRGRRTAGLRRRHAELAARSAAAYASFVLDTLDDPSAPWRTAGGT